MSPYAVAFGVKRTCPFALHMSAMTQSEHDDKTGQWGVICSEKEQIDARRHHPGPEYRASNRLC